MVVSCTRGDLGWILGENYLLKGLCDIGIDYPGKWLSHHPWTSSKNV